MSAHIKLIDVDRPREPLEVEVVELNAQMMRVAVPRTVMEFQLRAVARRRRLRRSDRRTVFPLRPERADDEPRLEGKGEGNKDSGGVAYCAPSICYAAFRVRV